MAGGGGAYRVGDHFKHPSGGLLVLVLCGGEAGRAVSAGGRAGTGGGGG
eukprot:SAG11_NODE_5605_length_1510_cov_1.582566_3_plen_48_part_01